MKREIAIEAFAKINIGLEIGMPRPDGYHPILGIFHSVGISDKIAFSRRESGGIRIEGAFDCRPEETTVYKAADLFRKQFGISGGFDAVVEKGIPAKAGLGGGSADAAAALVALDRLYETHLAASELCAMAARIGADVPFFLSGGAAMVSGIGDIIEPVAPRSDFAVLLIHPDFGVSTAWAFAELDSFRHGDKASPYAEEAPQGLEIRKDKLLSAYRGPLEAWKFDNSFKKMLYHNFPVYDDLEKLLKKAGALHVSITGSGSCMYGVFRSMRDAHIAEAKLKSGAGDRNAENTLYGMRLHAIKPLETSLYLG
ncbi:MAG: 4-(cytidine 5'-diphospho)-2-C-methyl-D-erythritol kinase [Candidatus Hydrogenedentales bacterium]